MDPELEHNEALVEEHPLIASCFLQVELESCLVELAFDSRGDDFGVPRVQKDADAALRRQRAPIAPRRRAHELFACAITEPHDTNVPRVPPFREPVGRFPSAPPPDPA